MNLLIGFPKDRPGGLVISLILAATALLFGFILSIPLAVLRSSNNFFLRFISRALTEFIRGLPLLVLILFVYSIGGQNLLGSNLTAFQSALLALTLYTASYQTEILISGFRSIQKEQINAAKASGLNFLAILRYIRLPIAFKNMIPAYTGQSISLFKDTSIVLIIGISDLMGVSNQLISLNNEKHFMVLLMIIGFIYFTIAFLLSKISSRYLSLDSNSKKVIDALNS